MGIKENSQGFHFLRQVNRIWPLNSTLTTKQGYFIKLQFYKQLNLWIQILGYIYFVRHY